MSGGDDEVRVHPFEVDGQRAWVIAVDRPALPATLSAAQKQVVEAVLDGHSNADIAAARGTSERTVANQLRAIYGKLGVNSREELVAKLVGAI